MEAPFQMNLLLLHFFRLLEENKLFLKIESTFDYTVNIISVCGTAAVYS